MWGGEVDIDMEDEDGSFTPLTDDLDELKEEAKETGFWGKVENFLEKWGDDPDDDDDEEVEFDW